MRDNISLPDAQVENRWWPLKIGSGEKQTSGGDEETKQKKDPSMREVQRGGRAALSGKAPPVSAGRTSHIGKSL